MLIWVYLKIMSKIKLKAAVEKESNKAVFHNFCYFWKMNNFKIHCTITAKWNKINLPGASKVIIIYPLLILLLSLWFLVHPIP